jgi:hypothetical protein
LSEVAAVRTPVSMGDVRKALRIEWRSLIGGALRSDVAALLLGLIDLETRTGHAVKNWNLGNQVVPAHLEVEQPWWEGVDSGNVRKFRSFDSLRAGARGLIRQLTKPSRKHWGRALRTGNPETFVAALGGKHGGMKYFEARFGRYRKAFLIRWQRYAPAGGHGVGPMLLLVSAAAVAGAFAYGMR